VSRSRPASPIGCRRRPLLLILAIASIAWGCARGVRVESRPTPPQPPPGVVLPDTIAATEPASRSARETLVSRAVADTLAASQALGRCAGRKLVPEQEATYDGIADLLAQARAAFAAGDTARAAQLAREARQLATSLNCF
jgi:hypothetical protein